MVTLSVSGHLQIWAPADFLQKGLAGKKYDLFNQEILNRERFSKRLSTHFLVFKAPLVK
jgi:hypothetical protein